MINSKEVRGFFARKKRKKSARGGFRETTVLRTTSFLCTNFLTGDSKVPVTAKYQYYIQNAYHKRHFSKPPPKRTRRDYLRRDTLLTP